ncbi:hypothetical protein [Streptomyces sp. NPDC004008]
MNFFDGSTAPEPPHRARSQSEQGFLVATRPGEIITTVVGPAGRSDDGPADPPRPDPDRDDWERITHDGRRDLGLIGARLRGADPVALLESWSGETPLHLAARHGSPEVVVDSRDGRSEPHEEIGLIWGDAPDLHWLYGFWQWDRPGLWDAGELAYASHRSGVRLTDQRAVAGPPRRWTEIPEGSPLLA